MNRTTKNESVYFFHNDFIIISNQTKTLKHIKKPALKIILSKIISTKCNRNVIFEICFLLCCSYICVPYSYRQRQPNKYNMHFNTIHSLLTTEMVSLSQPPIHTRYLL